MAQPVVTQPVMVQQQQQMAQQPVHVVQAQPVHMQQAMVQQPMVVQAVPVQQQHQQQPVMVGAPGVVPAVASASTDPFTLFANLNSIVIEQNLDILEAFVGWVQKNSYKVYDSNRRPLAVCKEDNDLCNLQCVPPSVRGWKIEVGALSPQGSVLPVLRLEKECAWACFCIDRPSMKIFDATTDSQLGRVEDPWEMCQEVCKIFDSADNQVYSVSGFFCQLGQVCPCPGTSTTYTVADMQGNEVCSYCFVNNCKSLLGGDTQNIKIDLTRIQSNVHRALIFATAMYYEMRLHNENPDGS